MKADKRTEYVTRDTIMKLLSDDEVAKVSTAETAAHLSEGDEYVDLQEPSKGIRRAGEKPLTPMGGVLPRKAVHDDTWKKIVGLLSAESVATSSSSG